MNRILRNALIIILMIIGLIVIIWANQIMMDYPGFREIRKLAVHEALPHSIIGMIVLFLAYLLSYVKTKN